MRAGDFGGLAASDSTMPASISAPSAASISLSTVHHHSPKGVRCARETMTETSPAAPPDAGLLVLTPYGLRRINDRFVLPTPTFTVAG